jgi:hypothetical protein
MEQWEMPAEVSENVEERSPERYLDVSGSIALSSVWSGFIWLRTGTGGGLL